jgi:hypothetical protein
MFIVMELAGGVLGLVLIKFLYPSSAALAAEFASAAGSPDELVRELSP